MRRASRNSSRTIVSKPNPGNRTNKPTASAVAIKALIVPAKTTSTTARLVVWTLARWIPVAPTTAGTIPATVTLPGGQLSGTFIYANNGSATSAVVSAQLGATVTATVTTGAAGGLVINEVDYDNVGTGDPDEFIELYNGTGAAMSLMNLALVLVNGNGNNEYLRVPLSGSIPANGYVVITNANLMIQGATRVTPSGWMAGDNVQNGAPDGVVLINTATGAIIDRLSYEGSITNATITGITGTVNLVEMAATPVVDSNTANGAMCRLPNGSDSNNASVDWAFCSVPTPGGQNMP